MRTINQYFKFAHKQGHRISNEVSISFSTTFYLLRSRHIPLYAWSFATMRIACVARRIQPRRNPIGPVSTQFAVWFHGPTLSTCRPSAAGAIRFLSSGRTALVGGGAGSEGGVEEETILDPTQVAQDLCKLPQSELAGYLQDSNFSVRMWTSIITSVGGLDWQRGRDILLLTHGRQRRHGNPSGSWPCFNVMHYNALITAAGKDRATAARRTLDIFQDIEQARLEPTYVTYILYIAAVTKTGFLLLGGVIHVILFILEYELFFSAL